MEGSGREVRQDFLLHDRVTVQDESAINEESGAGERRDAKSPLRFLPVFTVVLIITSIFIAYAVSVGLGHVEPDFPYISHTAVKIPERCIFAQLANIGAFLLGTNVYVRYLQQTEQYTTQWRHNTRGSRDRTCSLPCCRTCSLQCASLVSGLLGALCLSIVANFQIVGDVKYPHYAAVGLLALMTLVYCWLQTYISFRHPPRECTTILQITVSIVVTISFVICIVSTAIYRNERNEDEDTSRDVLRPVYLVSTISEWLTFFSGLVFLLTFYPSFSKVTLQGPRLFLLENRATISANSNGHNGRVSHSGICPVGL